MEDVYLLTGTNLGDREQNLAKARELVTNKVGMVLGISRIYKTAAWGKQDQPDFFNQAIKIHTSLQPPQLLQALQAIEEEMGRVRTERWGERIIDLDILFFGQRIIQEEQLTIPHAGIPERRFVLEPMAEIAPDLIHPVSGISVAELLRNCPDKLPVYKL